MNYVFLQKFLPAQLQSLNIPAHKTNKPATEPNQPVVEKKVIDKPQKKAAPVIDEEKQYLIQR